MRCTDLSTLDELLAAFDAPFVVRYADAMLPRWDALAESKERSSRQYCELDLSVDRTWAALRRSGEARGYNCSDGADFARWAAAAKAAGVRAKEATRQRVAKLLGSGTSQVGKTVVLKGWVRTVRSQKTFSFVELNDGSSLKGVQVAEA